MYTISSDLGPKNRKRECVSYTYGLNFLWCSGDTDSIINKTHIKQFKVNIIINKL